MRSAIRPEIMPARKKLGQNGRPDVNISIAEAYAPNARNAACPILNCPVFKIKVKPMTAIAQTPLEINMDRVMELLVNKGSKISRAATNQATDFGMTFL